MEHVSYSQMAPFDSQGLKIRELTPGQLQSDSVAEIEVVPGARHQRARSARCDKLYIGSEGEVLFRVENEAISLKRRDLLFIRTGEWFEYRNDQAQTARVILIHIPPFDLQSEEFFGEVIV